GDAGHSPAEGVAGWSLGHRISWPAPTIEARCQRRPRMNSRAMGCEATFNCPLAGTGVVSSVSTDDCGSRSDLVARQFIAGRSMLRPYHWLNPDSNAFAPCKGEMPGTARQRGSQVERAATSSWREWAGLRPAPTIAP